MPIRHPLATVSAQSALTERSGEPIELVLRDLVVFDEWTEDGRVSGVRPVVVELEPEAVPPSRTARAFWVDPEVVAWLENGDGTMDVDLAYTREAWDETVSVMHQQALAMLSGAATTEDDLRTIRVEVALGRADAGAAVLGPLVDDIVAAGDQVVEWTAVGGTIRANLRAETLERLLVDPLLRRVQVHRDNEPDAGYATTVLGPGLTGIEVADLLQTEPFNNLAHQGDSAEHVVVTEINADQIHNLHRSFRDGPSPADTRVLVCEDNADPDCTYVELANGVDHPTRVASVLASSLTLGQDPDCVSPGSCTSTDQRERSGVARTATLVGVREVPLERMMWRVLLDPDVHLLNHSASADLGDPDCTGATAECQDFNALFEQGVAIFNSNGNNGSSVDPDDCTIGEPATAIGVMAVGAYDVDAYGTEAPFATNSRGGTSEQGGGRTINALLAPTKHEYRAMEDWNDSPYYDVGVFGATSAATPAVTGSAAVFRDYYRTTHSTLIDDPGILYTFLQLMGDREDADGGHLAHEFDGMTGAGKLRLRMFDTAGLDDPKGWSAGSQCVQHGASYTLPINNLNTLPSAVDYVKAVIWWYDHDHDDGCDPVNSVCHDRFDLALQYLYGTSTWITVRSSTTDDNRQRVYLSGAGGDEYRLRITGSDVSSDLEGCGADANRVYFAWMFEDNARDDGGFLTTYVRPEP